MMAFLSLIWERVSGPVLLLLVLLLTWQSLRIEGVPLLGGGLKAQIVQMVREREAHALADAQEDASRLAAQLQVRARADSQARAQLGAERAADIQIRTVIREVPFYVSAESDAQCVLPWGAVRLLDAAASGADPAQLRDLIAPGQPDDAASDVALSEAVALLAGNLGAARINAGQLEHLQRALTPE